jgi:hypothetical protein
LISFGIILPQVRYLRKTKQPLQFRELIKRKIKKKPINKAKKKLMILYHRRKIRVEKILNQLVTVVGYVVVKDEFLNKGSYFHLFLINI